MNMNRVIHVLMAAWTFSIYNKLYYYMVDLLVLKVLHCSENSYKHIGFINFVIYI